MAGTFLGILGGLLQHQRKLDAEPRQARPDPDSANRCAGAALSSTCAEISENAQLLLAAALQPAAFSGIVDILRGLKADAGL